MSGPLMDTDPKAKIAGTPIECARDDDRGRSLLVSDLRVARDSDRVAALFETVCSAAREQSAATRLLILGDLFEFYVHVRQLEIGAWRRVGGAIAETVAAGVPVTVLHGNRDFLLGPRFERETGARVVAGGLRCRLAGRSALLLHGDELCLNDVAYQRARRWLRHPVTRFVARRLPLSVALRAGSRARRASLAEAEPDAGSIRYAPVARAVGEAVSGVDLLVFGHIHRPARGRFDGVEYCVLPAFDDTGVLLEATGEDLRFRTAAGEPVPDYPPMEFPD